MADDDKRRETDAPSGEIAPQKDRFLDVLKDLPRLDSAEKMNIGKKPYEPPSPILAKMGGFAQGCGALLVTLFTIPMVLVAVWFGFYTWGPMLLLFAGAAMIFSTLGVWRGRRMAVIIGLVMTVAVGIIGYSWSQFLPAVAALSPVPSLGPVYLPLTRIIALILIAIIILDAMTLLYWSRLKPISRRAGIIWGVFIVSALILTALFQTTQGNQRRTWLEDHRDQWQGDAQENHVVLGSNINLTLGFSFTTEEEKDDTRYNVSEAQLKAILDSGAPLVRLQAGGDMVLEAQNPRMFDVKEGDAEAQAKADARIERQQTLENQLMDILTASDAKLFISDIQYSPYLLIQADEEDGLSWDDFTALHEQRIRHYAELYKPAMYEIVTEPSSYKQFSGVDVSDDDAQQLDLWVTHTQQLIDAVKEVSPDTKVGVSIAINKDFELDYYERVLQLDGLDFVGMAVYQAAGWNEIDKIMKERGRPQDFGKELVIIETWYGYCLSPQRSMELDSIWLEAAVAFAAKEDIGSVITNDYGCFLQNGGTMFTDELDKNGRTKVWKTWRDLVRRRRGKANAGAG